jgi:hypothetical protein
VRERVSDRTLKEPPARYSSNASSAAKKRAQSASHDCAGAFCQCCAPLAIDRPQSSRSPMCARIWPGVRLPGLTAKAENSGDGSRSAFPAR